MKTLASAAGGLTLPTLPVMAAYVRACNGNVAEWEDRWHRLSDTVEPARRGTTAEPGAAADGAAGPGTAGPAPTRHRGTRHRGAQHRGTQHDGTGQVSRRAPGPGRGSRGRPGGRGTTGRDAAGNTPPAHAAAALAGFLPAAGPRGPIRPGSRTVPPAGPRAGSGVRHHVGGSPAPLPVRPAGACRRRQDRMKPLCCGRERGLSRLPDGPDDPGHGGQ